jgi:acyl-[acyl-carrier-protein]-phospholipid O-acyltransferase/long-chain-fatty-acid--[acyl-carrier-protein] ligase
MKLLLRWLLRLLYGFRACNTSVLNAPGPVLLLPNHVSWWDWLLLGVCLEDDWRFVTSSTTAERSWAHKRIMVNRRTFPIDMSSPYAVKHIAEYLQHGGRLVMFPEGRLSITGSLMKLFDGTGFLIFKTHAKVVTAYIRGAARLPFSPNPDSKRWFPRLSVHFSDVLATPAVEGISTTQARTRLTDWLRNQMIRQQFETEMSFGPATMPSAILAAARQQPGRVVLEDVSMQPLTYRRLVLGADLLSGRWKRLFGETEQRIGVLLPNVNAMPVTLLSLWAANKIPAVLNYTTGPRILLACARLAGLKQIITAKSFIARARIDLEPLKAAGIEILFLEDVRAGISRYQKIAAMLRQFPRPRLTVSNPQPSTLSPQPDRTATVLFTSGSEGDPKGVELSHRNLLANIRQMLSVIDLTDADRFFNALPLFHSYGLTVGLLLPLVQRVFVFLYPSPLHYHVIPSVCYNLDCTIFFGTNTFLAGYARKAHPYDFRALRYVFAGAEKLQENTSNLWMRKFGVRVLEGYGVTECSPCLSVNVAMHPCQGSAGQLLPGIEYRLEPVEGITEPKAQGAASDFSLGKTGVEARGLDAASPGRTGGIPQSSALDPRRAAGRLFVRGPNVMRGYLNPEANATFQALSGWYDTGDIAQVDADGFLHILGRLKRFAKVSGEMVSLAAVEEALAGAFPQYGLRFSVAVIAKPDEVKGERLIAVTNEPKLTLEEVREAIKARGLSNLAVPRQIKVLHDLPRLGSGKVNHRELERMG